MCTARGATAAVCLGSAVLLACAAARGEPAEAVAEGTALMRAVDARPRGDDQTLVTTWRLVGRSGHERVREVRSYWRDYRGRKDGVHSKRLLVFDAPPEVKDTAFLVESRLDASEDDRRWIYLPALRKVRRVASGDRGKAFMGSTFSYDDLAERGVREDVHRLLRGDAIDGRTHRVVESTPVDADAPYARRVQWVDPVSHTVSRIEYFDRQGRHAKTLDASWQAVDGVQVWRELVMRDLLDGERTRVTVDEARVNAGHGDDLFSEHALRLGVP